jgi:predicted anti-sigma-YlaC factor YlaD
MNIESNLSGHWTDEQLIEELYGIGPRADHIQTCSYCRERLSRMLAARRSIEAEASPLEQVSFDLLRAQRRSIYERLAKAPRWHISVQVRRWAAAGAMVALLSGGAMLYEQNQRQEAAQNKVTDAQLVQEVSRIANDSEPSPTAPLQELFDE